MLQPVSDTHSSQHIDIAAQSDSDTDGVIDSALTVLTEAPHINKDSSPLTVFMLFCFEITQLLLLLCSYRAHRLITVCYIPTYAQISGVDLYYIYCDMFRC